MHRCTQLAYFFSGLQSLTFIDSKNDWQKSETFGYLLIFEGTDFFFLGPIAQSDTNTAVKELWDRFYKQNSFVTCDCLTEVIWAACVWEGGCYSGHTQLYRKRERKKKKSLQEWEAAAP